MIFKNKPNQNGVIHFLFLAIITLIIAGVGYWIYSRANKQAPSKNSSITNTSNINEVAEVADSPSTIDSPSKISTEDNNQYFYYGAPAGQNNASPKKIIITLHGTEGSAETDYGVWKPLIKDSGFALAALNWWDGSGDKISDYSTPEMINEYIHEFLEDQGYTTDDLVVFQGFSRGSANSYSVVAIDQASSNPYIKIAVSSSGGVESGYYESTTKSVPPSMQSNIYSKVEWILACGGKDSNPNRDGCPAMEQTKQFVIDKGATVLGLLQDPNAGHGALTTSSLNLAKQMFELID